MERTTDGAVLEWSLLLAALRTLRGWSQQELASVSGTSRSTVSKQELGLMVGGAREKLEEALGVAGWTREAERVLGPLRALMIDPERQYLIRRIEDAESAAARITEAALGLALEDLRNLEDRGQGRPEGSLEWGILLGVLRTLRGWSQQELADASGVSTSAISKQELGIQTPSRGIQEKLEKALAVRGRMREIRIFLGRLRMSMLDPQRRLASPAIEEAGKAAARMTGAALRLGLEEMRKR